MFILITKDMKRLIQSYTEKQATIMTISEIAPNVDSLKVFR